MEFCPFAPSALRPITHQPSTFNATAALAAWQRARDVLAGQDAVRAAGEKHLPRLGSQSDEDYAAYKAGASFFGATARTLEEYLDLAFRRAPTAIQSKPFASSQLTLHSFTDS